MLLMHLFVCFVRVSFCHFSLPLGVGGWLRFVTVALPGFFYYFYIILTILCTCVKSRKPILGWISAFQTIECVDK